MCVYSTSAPGKVKLARLVVSTYASALKFAIENSWWELSRKRWQMASLAHVLTSSYHVHPTWDGEGTCTVFFMFLPAKGPFVTTHNPLMEWLHSLLFLAVMAIF